MDKINDRLIQLETDVLAANDKKAGALREQFKKNHVLVLNFVSSPGSGKTTLLCNTIHRIKNDLAVTVIEGDQQTLNDAERIRATGCPAVQINTGEGCHLDAEMVERALAQLDIKENSLLFIENVGNLVCPAAFDLGEECKVVVLSTTEGEDKPLKYPDMFAASKLMLINKTDLLPYVDFDMQKCREYAKRVNPEIEIIEVSATKGDGMDAWIGWLKAKMQSV